MGDEKLLNRDGIVTRPHQAKLHVVVMVATQSARSRRMATITSSSGNFAELAAEFCGDVENFRSLATMRYPEGCTVSSIDDNRAVILRGED